jgi:hypothetical protein
MPLEVTSCHATYSSAHPECKQEENQKHDDAEHVIEIHFSTRLKKRQPQFRRLGINMA